MQEPETWCLHYVHVDTIQWQDSCPADQCRRSRLVKPPPPFALAVGAAADPPRVKPLVWSGPAWGERGREGGGSDLLAGDGGVGGASVRAPPLAAVAGRAIDAIASYLVDPASSHMLVSKIKPCMSKYKPI